MLPLRLVAKLLLARLLGRVERTIVLLEPRMPPPLPPCDEHEEDEDEGVPPEGIPLNGLVDGL